MRPRRRGEAGFTVIELGVVVLIMGIASAALLSVLISLTRTHRTQEAMIFNQEQVRLAMTQLTRDLRAADPLQPLTNVTDYPNGFDASLTSTGNGPDISVRWRLTGTTLTRSLLTGPGGSVTSTRTVLTNVRNVAQGVPLLRYYSSNDSEITTAATSGDFVNCAVRVHITITADSDPGPVPFAQNSDTHIRNRLPGGVGC
jgi:type II secretory pathway pseudopilin PulG